jgi:transposase-like protein
VLLCADADAAAADLASGALACPSCGIGRLRAWGYGRERVIRALGGERRRLRPRRGRCRSCGATHILLPAWSAPRRADAVGVIARAVAASVLHGTGTARLGAELGVPAATVRGWLRRLRERAGQMLQEATAEFGRLVAVIETAEGRDPSPPGPTGSRLGDALALVAACAVAAVRWHGRAEADLEALAGRFGLAAALTPAPGN